MQPTDDKLQHVVDSHHGIYSPQIFAQRFPKGPCADEDWRILLEGPDHPNYWDVWSDVADNWESDGFVILESEGIFLVRAEVENDFLDLGTVPEPVKATCRRKGISLSDLRYDHLCGFYYPADGWKGMFLGIEPDGHAHT